MSDISEDLYLTFSRTKEFNLKKKKSGTCYVEIASAFRIQTLGCT